MASSKSIFETIESSFEELGIVYNKDVVAKCVDLCIDHGIDDAEELVDSWMAFSVSHLQGDDPTSQHLARFEREVLSKKTQRKNTSVCETTLNITDPESAEILSAYNVTPQRKNARTPDANKTLQRLGDASRTCFSPASFSPVVGTPSSRYEGRRNAGSVMCDKKYAGTEDTKITTPISISQISPVPGVEEKFMAFHLSDYADAVERQSNRIIDQLSARYTFEEIMPLHMKHPTAIVTAGRIICDADGKLNSESALLEASPDSGGETVRLDLTGVPTQAVFPGQVVAVSGINVSGSKFVAQKIYSDASLPEPPLSLQLPGSLKIIIASGPYTTSDSMSYQPLLDFLTEVVREEPNLLILMGPLIDSEHSSLRENLLAESVNGMFQRLLEQIMEPLSQLTTEVVFVSSHRDCNGHAVFPTPAHSLPRAIPKLKFVPDPCVLNVEGVIIALTSNDILMHLGREEFTLHGHHSGDRLTRLACHILEQQSMYPLRPPPLEVPYDPSLDANLSLPVNPHILVLPSDLRCFIKDIKGVTVVNPEHLAKGLVGGSFAKLTVSPSGSVYGQVLKI